MKEAILITGAAGFIGGHLVHRLCSENETVVGIDNFYTGSREKITKLLSQFQGRFFFLEHDVRSPLDPSTLPLPPKTRIKEIFHLACPASPPQYSKDPMFTIDTAVRGVRNILECAKEHHARFLFTSTSEVYGDPLEHPQSEGYRGNVNTWGPRACYDEGKRIGETICYYYEQLFHMDIRIARIFNTYGPGMDPSDGRVITNFFKASREGRALEVYGDGTQTRSFCYVDDMIDGLIKLCRSDAKGPVNLGNPEEHTISEVAQLIHSTVGKGPCKTVRKPFPSDDPKQRRPDITRAMEKTGWKPKVSLAKGLEKMFCANTGK